ncbi:hypothetical protein C8R43DRAFT_947821 [Mycena crocata]|nr:hypothetical protein C8R43DRAFT_947821 [Mycena crocata]
MSCIRPEWITTQHKIFAATSETTACHHLALIFESKPPAVSTQIHSCASQKAGFKHILSWVHGYELEMRLKMMHRSWSRYRFGSHFNNLKTWILCNAWLNKAKEEKKRQGPRERNVHQTRLVLRSLMIGIGMCQNVPMFVTDDFEDLMLFVDQVTEISSLAGVTGDEKKKRRFTSYLPTLKKDSWQTLASYSEGTFEEFLEEIYKSYPEIKAYKTGSVEAWIKVCRR